MILFLLMNAVVLYSAFILVYKIFKLGNSVDSILSIFVFYLAQIIATELTIGIFGSL